MILEVTLHCEGFKRCHVAAVCSVPPGSVSGASPPGVPPAAPPSVYVHRGDGGGGDLIQDANHVGGDVHEPLLEDQDEWVFLVVKTKKMVTS